MILKRALRASDHQWNPKFEDFFSHHGFIPRLCKPYCPQTKGKIENTIGYVKRMLSSWGLREWGRPIWLWLSVMRR